jgi:hypothetical protein
MKSEMSFAKQLLSKQVPAATNTQAAIKLIPLLCNDAVNAPSQQEKDCASCTVCAK